MCKRIAEWEIWEYPYTEPHMYTHACSEHVGELLSDAVEHKIVEAPENCRCCFIGEGNPDTDRLARLLLIAMRVDASFNPIDLARDLHPALNELHRFLND